MQTETDGWLENRVERVHDALLNIRTSITLFIACEEPAPLHPRPRGESQ